MKTDKKLISLKEAAKLSGYSSDYIGQLIRAGKIPGQQVYSNIAWMTTGEAVLEYKNKGKNVQKPGLKDRFNVRKRQLGMQFGILKLFFQTFKSSWPIFLIVVISFIFLVTYFIYLTLDYNYPKNINKNEKQKIQKNISF